MLHPRLDTYPALLFLGRCASLSESAGNYVYASGGTESIALQTRNLGTSPVNVAGLGFDIVFSGSSLGNTIIIRYHNQVTEDGLSSINRWFSSSPKTNIGLNATLRFRYLDSEMGGNDETSLSLYRKPTAGSWTEGGGTRNTTSNYVELTAISAFSEWTLDNGGALPIEISFAEVSYSEEGNILHWQTLTEFENYGFYIERISPKEKNTFDWQEIGFVRGAGPIVDPQDYVFADANNSLAGTYVYRLRQVDYDGTVEIYNLDGIQVNAP